MSLAGKATLRGVKKLNRDMVRERKRFRKAQEDAVKVVSYRRLRNLAQEIRKGAPGGRGYSKLSTIARFNFRNKSMLSSRKPFTGLQSTQDQDRFLKGLPPVRYAPIKGAGGRLKKTEVGMTNKGIYPSGRWWIRAGNIWQSGGSVPIDEDRKRVLRYMGALLKKSNPRSKLANRFFLRKSTTRVKHEKREIIGPFWRKWRRPSIKELDQVFKAKLAGRRV